MPASKAHTYDLKDEDLPYLLYREARIIRGYVQFFFWTWLLSFGYIVFMLRK